MARSTKIETDRRIFIVQGWIMNRVPDYLILKQCQDQFTNGDGVTKITERQAKNYLKKAYEIWHNANEATIEQERQMSIDKLLTEQRNMKPEFKGTPAGMRTLLAIEREINRLRGTYHPKRIMHQGDPDNPILPTDPKEVRAIIDDLLSKRNT